MFYFAIYFYLRVSICLGGIWGKPPHRHNNQLPIVTNLRPPPNRIIAPPSSPTGTSPPPLIHRDLSLSVDPPLCLIVSMMS
ncbi:hypothetical protein AAZX31_09G009100 [Glycine max]|nr:hypothetical protein GLYMA_09G009251v4 [Glycine max]KAH1040905.1 hypothetical protein GYH30_023662 [Glycine max]